MMVNWLFNSSQRNAKPIKKKNKKKKINNHSWPKIPYETYTLEEVSKHRDLKDLWMVIYNKVYDVSPFISKHPGGIEVLIDCGGVDATKYFEDVGHSDYSKNMLKPLFKGDLIASERIVYSNGRDIIPDDEEDKSVEKGDSLNDNNNNNNNNKHNGLNLFGFLNSLFNDDQNYHESTLRNLINNEDEQSSISIKKKKKKKSYQKCLKKRLKLIFSDSTVLLLLVAIISGLLFVYLQKRKWENNNNNIF